MCPGSRSQFYTSSSRETPSGNFGIVTDTLGQISGQIANMQQCLTSLTSNVEELSSRTMELTNRVAALEDVTLESQPGKKKIEIPRDLSVRCYIKAAIFSKCYLLILDSNKKNIQGAV